MAIILPIYDSKEAKASKEKIFNLMEENCFSISRMEEGEAVIYYLGLKISRKRGKYSIKDCNAYHEIDNLLLLQMIYSYIKDAINNVNQPEETR